MRTTFTAVVLLAAGVIGWDAHADTTLTPAEAKAIAQEGYLFGFRWCTSRYRPTRRATSRNPSLDVLRSISSITTESSQTPRTTRSSG